MSHTISEIAARAGTSYHTVRRYLRGGTLRESSRRVIEQALQELEAETPPSAEKEASTDGQ